MTQNHSSIRGLAAAAALLIAVAPSAGQVPTPKLLETVQRAAEKSLDSAQRCCRTLPIASKAREDCFDASNKAAVRLAEGEASVADGDAPGALSAFEEADSLARKAMANCPTAGGLTDPFALMDRLTERATALSTRIAMAQAPGATAPDAAMQARISHAKDLLATIQEAVKLARTHLAAGQRPEASQNLTQAEEAAHEAASLVLTKMP